MACVNFRKIITKYIKTPLGLENRYFTQFAVSLNKEVKPSIISDFSIKGSVSSFKLNKVDIVDTMEGTSIEGQHLTGKSLSIVGTIFLDIAMKSKKSCEKYLATETIPFSTFIVVPKGICMDDDINIGYFVENLDVVKIACNKLFISVLLIIQYEDFSLSDVSSL